MFISVGMAKTSSNKRIEPVSVASDPHSDEAEVAAGVEGFRKVLGTLNPHWGPEYDRKVLNDTPARAAKAFREMTAGLKVKDPKAVVGKGIFDVPEARDVVSIRDMPFHSLCEHHLLPFSGMAHIAYLPQGKVLGLSKFPRLLHIFARRPQVQERLTTQFAESVMELLNPKAVAVAMEATHGCMCHRGVGVDAYTRTIALRGPGVEDAMLFAQLREAVAFDPGQRHARL